MSDVWEHDQLVYGASHNYAEWLAGSASSDKSYTVVWACSPLPPPLSQPPIGLANIAQTGNNLAYANIALVFRNY